MRDISSRYDQYDPRHDWIEHFGEIWPALKLAKEHYDPNHLLAPVKDSSQEVRIKLSERSRSG
ncbi:hypothetical protein [Phyllobacterium sp. P5_D12]